MICAVTGDVVLDAPSLRIPAEVRLAAFLELPEANTFKRVLWSDTCHRYFLEEAMTNGQMVTVQLEFYDQMLREAVLSVIVQSADGEPLEWNAQGEQGRHEKHLALLRGYFPQTKPDEDGRFWFDWGNACAVLDSREGRTEMRVDYLLRKKPIP